MKTITVSVFSKETGEISRVISVPESWIAANVPEGFDYKRGRFDKRRQRVDLETGEVVEIERSLDQSRM